MVSGAKKRFEIERVGAGEPVVLELRGSIDEHSDLSLLHDAKGSSMLLVLKDIVRVNSVGVKKWIQAINRIDDGTDVVLSECSLAIVAQINMVKNFAGRARIRSFYAPYYCSGCDAEFRFLYDVDHNFGAVPFQAPPAVCPQCQQQLVFDDIEADYLQVVAIARGMR
ncbi:MAG: hypothetical protein KC609_14355 [Myxococcales bacterium]|nr:hypothetical protein [Myxococcales bacterium]